MQRSTTERGAGIEDLRDSGSEPVAPASVPKYVREGVEAQDVGTLRDLAAWAEALAEYRENRSIAEEAPDGVEVLEVNEDDGSKSGGTEVIRKNPCGKDSCTKCPHGPYRYIAHREGKKVMWDYKGPV
jgi:hypothetical protein